MLARGMTGVPELGRVVVYDPKINFLTCIDLASI